MNAEVVEFAEEPCCDTGKEQKLLPKWLTEPVHPTKSSGLAFVRM
jgi:hypothetical protein